MTERQIEGFTCEGVSDGERLCTGCWDNSDNDTKSDNDIARGEPIYWQRASFEYDEWNPYCESCARAMADNWAMPVGAK